MSNHYKNNKSKDPANKNFDPSELSMVELSNADSFTRGARLEQITKLSEKKGGYKGNYDMYMASQTPKGVWGSNGERNSASNDARYAGAVSRSKMFQWAANADEQKKRQQLSEDSESMRGELSSLRSELGKVKEAQAAGAAAAAPPEKGDMQIEGVTNEDLERSAAKSKAQDWLNTNSQPTSSGIFNTDSGDQQAPTAESATEEKVFNNEKYKVDFASQATNKKAPDFSGV